MAMIDSRADKVRSRRQWQRRRTWKKVVEHRYLYMLLSLTIIFLILFSYLPMFNMKSGGVLLAFKQYRFNTAFADMEWVGLKWFDKLWGQPEFWRAFKNTLIISFGRLLIEFPAPIILALMLNEVSKMGLKRVYQTVYTFPHFISWVLVVSVMRGLFATDGVVNQLMQTLGKDTIPFLISNEWFYPMVFGTSIWKGVGWSSIIYLAAISGIDPGLYEAAAIDGANRWHCIRHITWPGIKSTAVILLILQCGNILNANFNQIFNLINDANMKVGEIFDTFIYRYAFWQARNFSFTVAAGLFKSVINFALLLTANSIVKMMGEESLL